MSRKNAQNEDFKISEIIERLKTALDVKGDVDIARALDVDPRLLGVWKGRNTIPYERIISLCIKNHIDLEWMFAEEGDVSTEKLEEKHLVMEKEGYIRVPRYEVHASAGGGAIIHSEQIVDHLYFKADWVKNVLGIPRDSLALIAVHGDSMEPTLSNGDLILVDTRVSRVEDGAIYVLQFDDALLVKRLQKKFDGSVVIRSDNPLYEPEILHGDDTEKLNIVGRVVWAGGII